MRHASMNSSLCHVLLLLDGRWRFRAAASLRRLRYCALLYVLLRYRSYCAWHLRPPGSRVSSGGRMPLPRVVFRYVPRKYLQRACAGVRVACLLHINAFSSGHLLASFVCYATVVPALFSGACALLAISTFGDGNAWLRWAFSGHGRPYVVVRWRRRVARHLRAAARGCSGPATSNASPGAAMTLLPPERVWLGDYRYNTGRRASDASFPACGSLPLPDCITGMANGSQVQNC